MKKIKEVPRQILPDDITQAIDYVKSGIENGDVIGVAYAAIHRNGRIATGYSTIESQIALMGGLEYCKQRISKEVEGWESV